MNMNMKFYALFCFMGFCLPSVWADIVGTLKYPPLTFFRDKAEVMLKNVKTGEVISKTLSDRENHFTFSNDARSLYTIIARTEVKNSRSSKFVGECSLWGNSDGNITINMIPIENVISIEGRIVSPKGIPMPECLVSVDPGGYGLPEYGKWPVFICFTDSMGRWKVDRIRPPAKWAVKAYLERPELIAQPPLVDQSLTTGILVKGGVDYKRYACLSVPLITENMRKKLGDVVKNTTLSLPVSTNNDIYVGDIVLPDKKQQGKN